MRSRRMWRMAGGLVVLMSAGGCRTGTPPGQAAHEQAPPAESVHMDTESLLTRPLYTFTEEEVGRYLPLLHGAEPDLAARVVRLGRQNIGQPYDIYLLGEFPYDTHDPDPIYCLRKSDCVTFCEHMYSMALGRDWWEFLRILQRLRYVDGVVSMLTRNHHTVADWDRNNAFLFEDMTTMLGGGKAAVPMYHLCRRAAFFAKFGIGQDIPDEPIHDAYIPKERVPEILAELHPADFVNIIRGDADSQWAGHTGLIAQAADGTVNFLHSAKPAVREQPLMEYLTGDKRCLGIKILRLRPDAERIMQETLAASPRATEISESAMRAALTRWPATAVDGQAPGGGEWRAAMQLQSYRLGYASTESPGLSTELAYLDAAVGEELGIPEADRAFGVLDLTDLGLAMVRPDEMFYGASVPKIAIVLAYFETNPQAVTNLDPAVERELQLVIKRSDNELAAKYSQLVGLEKIQALLQGERYRLYDQEHGGGLWCGKHYGIEEPRFGDPLHDHSHGVNVRQALRYYLLLEQGKLVSAAGSARIKEIFAAPGLEFHDNGFVRGLTGRDVTLIRKGGLWEDWHLDTARVRHGSRVYLLAGMAHHARGDDYLARMAAGLDEVLCGPETRKLPQHELILHDEPADFSPGAFTAARLDAEGRNVVLGVSAEQPSPAYESPVLPSAAPFNEALVSTNMDCPPGCGFTVELRVGRRFTDTWSPWIHIFEWGTVPAGGERVRKCPEGYVDVDYFRSTERYDRAQYRLRGFGPAGSANLRVARVAVCLSDTTGLPTSVPRAASAQGVPHASWQRRLPVPFRTQGVADRHLAGKICSPTSLAMVMAYRGVDCPTLEVVERCLDRPNGIYGNWPVCVQAAYSLGVPGYLSCFGDWREVERMIAAGQPLVISIRTDGDFQMTGAPYHTTDGHLLVVTGFDAQGMVEVNDPAARTAEKGQLRYLRSDLEEVWMRTKGGAAYVLLPRE